MIFSSVVLFLFSHAVAFKLHAPQRFSKYGVGLSFVMAVALPIAAVFVSALHQSVGPHRRRWIGRVIVAIVRFPIDPQLPADEVRAMLESSAPTYQKLPGLMRKH